MTDEMENDKISSGPLLMEWYDGGIESTPLGLYSISYLFRLGVELSFVVANGEMILIIIL